MTPNEARLRAALAEIETLCRPHNSPASNTGAHRLAVDVLAVIREVDETWRLSGEHTTYVYGDLDS